MLVPLDSPNANTRVTNLKRGIEEYVAEYNICKCKPCRNGGSLALIDGKCICLCTGLFEGLACQNFKADKASNQGKKVKNLQYSNSFFIKSGVLFYELIQKIYSRSKAHCK